MEKLKAEIVKWDGVNLDRNELRSMTYLQNVLKESQWLRIPPFQSSNKDQHCAYIPRSL